MAATVVSVFLLLLSINTSQGINKYILKTYEVTPRYLKGTSKNMVQCQTGREGALEFEILNSGLTNNLRHVSFRSTQYDRHYLRRVDWFGYLSSYPQSNSPSFNKAGSFVQHNDYFYEGTISYESVDLPGHFLTCTVYGLVLAWIQNGQSGIQSLADGASFYEVVVGGVINQEWGPCTKSCDGGIQLMLEECIFGICPDPKYRSCNTQACKKTDVCDPNPCTNGVCRIINREVECFCYPGWTGFLCDTQTDPCESSPCLNGGRCVPAGSTFTCSCREEFTGELCDQIADPCTSAPCENGGKCESVGTMFTCTCPPGFAGKSCEIRSFFDVWSACSKSCGGGTRYMVKSCAANDVDECPRVYEDCALNKCKAVTCRRNKIHRFGMRSECCKIKTSRCGVPDQDRVEQRIIGGVRSQRGEWPWMAALYYKPSGRVICGAAIISERWIITAAHCVRCCPATELQVLIGTVTRQNQDASAKKHDVDLKLVHPDYTAPDNDLALLKLKSDISYNRYIKPICLPGGERVEEDAWCVAAGWGVDEISKTSTQTASDYLQHISLRILPLGACIAGYNGTQFANNIDGKDLCVGLLGGGKDTCVGDSGGPLVCQRKGSCEWFLAGVTSLGPTECAIGKIPGVNVHIVHYEGWILRTMSAH